MNRRKRLRTFSRPILFLPVLVESPNFSNSSDQMQNYWISSRNPVLLRQMEMFGLNRVLVENISPLIKQLQVTLRLRKHKHSRRRNFAKNCRYINIYLIENI